MGLLSKLIGAKPVDLSPPVDHAPPAVVPALHSRALLPYRSPGQAVSADPQRPQRQAAPRSPQNRPLQSWTIEEAKGPAAPAATVPARSPAVSSPAGAPLGSFPAVTPGRLRDGIPSPSDHLVRERAQIDVQLRPCPAYSSRERYRAAREPSLPAGYCRGASCPDVCPFGEPLTDWSGSDIADWNGGKG
jgi:hypothetical protein